MKDRKTGRKRWPLLPIIFLSLIFLSLPASQPIRFAGVYPTSCALSARFTRNRLMHWPKHLVSLVASLVASLLASPAPAQQPAAPFGLTKVWSIHLQIPAEEFAAMQPAAPALPGFGGPPAPAVPAPAGKRDSERNLFGTAFPWASGELTVGDQSPTKVGIRYAGDITYFVSANGLKRPLAIRLDGKAGGPLAGVTSLHLHSMPLDPAKAREALACAMFRAAGVPTPRTALAEVTLTVPGKHDKAYLGLYTVVEGVDAQFLAAQFKTDKGLVLKPFGIRGIDYLGDEWSRYQASYRPQRAATDAEARRVIEFARLVNQASDDDFRRQIDSFLDVDAFLRFLAANALAANLESFFALGHNYHLYLHPETNKFVFLPGDLEFSLANFLLMGSADELCNLSLTKPYPGENKLPDRLLAIESVRQKYQALLKELATTAFNKEKLIADADAIDVATGEIRDREAKAATARGEAAPGFGGPAPQPPSIKAFAEKRAASIAAQLAGTSTGYVPRPFGFGGPAGGGPRRTGPEKPIDEAAFRESVVAPPEFEATLFAAPPQVGYPVAIAAAPTGEVYVAVDEQGSLGRTPGGGKILRCIDHDGDGRADTITEYAKVDHPRGVCYRDGAVWVMHPPTLSVFHDDNGDGQSDRQDTLVTGLTTSQITERGGDHTTNCVRLGIDGWLYIGVGDYGIHQATGKDGRTISLRGGGVVRVRPDGTELEIYCTGLRNPFDLAIDPALNLFTRDNTNDGAGWDVRVSHLVQSAEYGYPRLFANFTDETMPTLGAFGGGGGTGGLFLDDHRWPEKFRNSLLTGDWGRSEVYLHELAPHGPTFDLTQEVFLKMPRATGMDLDASGRLYVASWFGGEASVHVGPNVGFVTRVVPKGLEPRPLADLKREDTAGLVRLLSAPEAITRLHAQGELLRRGRSADTSSALLVLAQHAAGPLAGRVAAIFTLKQLEGQAAQPRLVKLAEDDAIREFALRALTDRTTQLDGLTAEPFIAALADPAPRVRAQALISLGRLNDQSAAKHVLPLTSRPAGSAMPTQRPVQNQPDPDRVIPHLAMRTLISLNASDACLEALDGPHATGALMALRSMHTEGAVQGLIKKLGTTRDSQLRRGILATLARLHSREADYDGSWWGIRPDSSGPYYDPAPWQMSQRIGAVLTAAVLDSDPETAAFLRAELARHKVALPGVPSTTDTVAKEAEKPIVIPPADPTNPNQIGNLPLAAASERSLAAKGEAARGQALFKSQSCVACHTTTDGQTPKGPHLVDIGKRYKPAELAESVLSPSAKIAQGYETYAIRLVDGRVVTGFVVRESAASVLLREANGTQQEIRRDEIDQRAPQTVSAMPNGLVGNLTPEQLADLLAYLQSL
jgi:putative membrane-bound dehydrogenase-like protein